MNMNQKEDARIQFTGMAVQGLLANRWYAEKMARDAKDDKEFVKMIATDAVEVADALIEELERTEVHHD